MNSVSVAQAVAGHPHLPKTLLGIQQQKFTGVIKVTVTETASQQYCFVYFQEGRITYAERNSLLPQEIITTLARCLNLGCIDALLQYVSRRVPINEAPMGEILDIIVSTKITTWEDIEGVIINRAVVILEQFLAGVCDVQAVPDRNLGFAHSENYRGIACSQILECIGQRQKQWQEYLPILRALNAIPKVRERVVQSIDHEPTKQHLLGWVDGKRSFVEIAAGLEKDPLALAPIYCRWASEGLIDFYIPSEESAQLALPVVLSVDDSPIVQTMIRRALCEKYEVTSASSAVEALGVLNQRRVNLILLDVTMPEIDGFEFCRTIRKISKFKDIPVVMLTAKDGIIDRAKGHLAGTNRYLTKPVQKEELLKVVGEFLG